MRAIPRRAQRRDANEAELVKFLQAFQFDVERGGPLDLLVYVTRLAIAYTKLPDTLRGRLFAIEVKDPAKPPSARQPTDAELKYLERTPGASFVAYSGQHVLDQLTAIAEEYHGSRDPRPKARSDVGGEPGPR